MANTTYTIVLRDSGIKAFTVPEGFYSDMEIHCWGAGGGGGRGAVTNTYGGFGVAGLGGGGGYAKTTIDVNVGDEITLQIGQPGGKGGYPLGGKGGFDASYPFFRGGNAGNVSDEDADTGAGGGGGGASWVAVNGTIVCAGAGGGGAGGLGDDRSGGNPGLPGGVTSNGLNTNSRGGDSASGGSSGGGGGAGYPFGGAAGTTFGDDAGNPPAGSGGQNYGNVTVAGSGVFPGGTNVSYYPGQRRGESGYPGYIVIIFRKKLNISIKNADGSGNWSNVVAAYTKTPISYVPGTQPQPTQNLTVTVLGNSTFVVPDGVTAISVTMIGAGGSGADGSSVSGSAGGGQAGTIATGSISVTPGETLILTVGRGGTPVSYASGSAGIAGQATTIRRGTTVLLSAAGGAGGTRTGSSDGQASGAPFNGAGGISGWGTGGTDGGIGAGGGGVDGNANGFTSGNGGRGEIRLTYTPTPTPIIITTGGWKQIQQAFTKVNGIWKPILTNREITLVNAPVRRITANISIVADTDDYNLLDSLPVTYFPGLMDIDVWVYPNVVITGNTTSTAFTVSGFAEGDRITLRNYGYLAGRGGQGGSGGYTYSSGKTTASAPPSAGGSGGTGLLIDNQITLINNGNIAGGGGGGGGGAAVTVSSGKSTSTTAGGAGGGGAGYGLGFNNGTLTSGGAGQNVSGSGDGGNGGARGQAGQAGGAGGAAGGRAGFAIQGILNLVTGSNVGSYFGPLGS